ncbi:hypothetical protein F3Y22_tig00116925pilonHSYRG00008 [Hibiscus syriacus]|uniref:Uncharacterized protein n=1 Tax=Hibiscus syriacus TaxID=106335 RepID=A0A6A2XGL2_HIBSY|nr:hypothetical protein F3Y22_tig00116925pilonHSYRG00008 [Hibiscus syriacus]
MCSSKAKVSDNTNTTTTLKVSRFLDSRNSLKKIPPISPLLPQPLISMLPSTSVANGCRAKALLTSPLSPSSKFPNPVKRGSDPNGLNISFEKVVIPISNIRTLERKKSKSFKEGMGNRLYSSCVDPSSLSYSSALLVEAPGRDRNQPNLYLKSPLDNTKSAEEKKRCSFITPNSDPIYVAYHDEEWGVPIHDDNMLFELLVPSGAQVGSDWTSILKKRQDFRDAFSGFDAETVAKFTGKQMTTTSTHYRIDKGRVRGVVDNSNRILEVKREFGSFNRMQVTELYNRIILFTRPFSH